MFYKQLLKDLQKRKNSKLIAILEAIWSEKATNRRDLCLYLNLSKGTMTKRINFLLEKNYVVENGFHASNGLGRNPEKLKLNDDLFYSVGIYHTEKQTTIAVFNANNKLIRKTAVTLPALTSGSLILKEMLELIKQNLNGLSIAKEKLLGIGITIPGIVAWDKGIVYSSGSFPGENGLRVKQFFVEALDCECEMLNISHLIALNEKNWGKAGNVSNFLCVEDSLGMGIFVNNQLCCGWQGYSGEFGFMQIKENGEINVDGRRGTIWSNAAFYNILNALRRMQENNETLQIEKYLPPGQTNIDVATVIRAASDGDRLCSAMIAESYEWIAKGIVNAAYMLNPEVVYLPSWTAECPACTIEVVKQHLKHYGVANWHLKTRVESAACDKSYLPGGIALYLTQCTLNKAKRAIL